MKKYTLSLFVLAFIVSLFNVNVSPLNATTTATTPDCVITNTLRKGSAGAEVICLQKFLGISADGKFGLKTKAAVIAFQTSNNLVPDGIVGLKSRTVLQGTNTTKIGTNTGGTINTNKLNVNPGNATIKVGATTTLQAFLSICGELACVTNSSAVRAEWATSNSQIAKVEYKNTCPPGAYCFVGPDLLTAVVTGVSQGIATVTATYKDSSENTLTANALITVEEANTSLNVTFPQNNTVYNSMPTYLKWESLASYSSTTTYFISGYFADQILFSTTVTGSQSGCSITGQCSYPLTSLSQSGTYTFTVKNMQNNASGSVTFTVNNL